MKWLAALALAAACPAQAQSCPPAGWDRARLEALRAAEFEVADRGARQAFAEAVVACVAAPDPFLRDGVAFAGLQRMLRTNQLDTGTRLHIARDLLARLSSRDPNGFEAPFAALVLAEIARADGLDRYLADDLRAEIVARAADYVAGVRDYRGLDAREGWRHGVAHGGDLLMQIARNPHVAPAQLARVRDAVAAQVMPADHFYIYGEPERLARPIIFLAQRGVFEESDWIAWFARLADPAPLTDWDQAFSSQTGLARRHNLRAFLQSVWINARITADGPDDALLAGAEAALRAVP